MAVRILDACCGSKMFWFDKDEPHTTYMDIRQETFEIHGRKVNVKPDVVGDFRDMPFEDETFNLVVFDPPHLKWAGPNSIMKAQYGQLDKVTWSEDLAKGFDECMRVLKVGGTLVFKWSDCQINVKKLLEVIPYTPLFGQQRGTTHWMTFMKFEEETDDTPEGQYSYHYDLEHWELFNVKELDKAPEYDGHKPEDVTRLLSKEIKDE